MNIYIYICIVSEVFLLYQQLHKSLASAFQVEVAKVLV